MPGREEALRRARQRISSAPDWSFADVQGQLTSPVRWNPSQSRGPVSTLPTPDPEELYSRYVPYGDSPVRGVPFGREFDFTETDPPPRGFLPNRTGTIGERSKRFIDQYFGGQDSVVINPATGRQYGNELKIHDALHEYANAPNTLRGEELITAGEKAATRPLQGTGLLGLTQQDHDFKATKDPDRSSRMGELLSEDSARSGRTLVQTRGAARGSSLFRDRNSPGSFLSPPLSMGEINEMVRRSREFYDQVHAGWGSYLNEQGLTTRQARETQTPIRSGSGTDLSNPFIQGRAPNVEITGGYRDPGGMPFGNRGQLMNPPVVPVVEYEPWNRSLGRQIGKESKSIAERASRELAEFRSPEQTAMRLAQERWMERESDLRMALNSDGASLFSFDQKNPEVVEGQFRKLKSILDSSPNQVFVANPGNDPWSNNRIYMPEEIKKAIPQVIGPMPEPPALGNTARYMNQEVEGRFGGRSLGHIKQAVRDDIDFKLRGVGRGGITAGLGDADGRLYLNPPNLGRHGFGNRHMPWMSPMSDSRAQDMLLTAARDAKDFPKVKNAIRSTTAGAAALGGALPLTSESVWRAAGRGDYGDAARQAAVEIGIGLAASPVIGAAGGVLQRVAPAVAPAALGALGTAALATLPTQAAQALSGFLEERTGKGLPVRTMEAQDTAAGMTRSMQAASPRRTYSEGWITVPGKGRRWRDSQGNYFMQQPGMVRTAPAQTARQVTPQLFPTPRSVPANTPSGVARLTRTQQQNPVARAARNRVALFRQRFNPARGDFGFTELVLGR